jgi:hypothetical protein
MCPTTLRPLLAKANFAPDDLSPASLDCHQWFNSTASLESFVLSSILHDLLARFGDPQAVPLDEWNRFIADVLPRIIAVLDIIPADPVPALRDLVLGYHSSL